MHGCYLGASAPCMYDASLLAPLLSLGSKAAFSHNKAHGAALQNTCLIISHYNCKNKWSGRVLICKGHNGFLQNTAVKRRLYSSLLSAFLSNTGISAVPTNEANVPSANKTINMVHTHINLPPPNLPGWLSLVSVVLYSFLFSSQNKGICPHLSV